MTTRFAHVEILGPRASLDAWLAALQDAGACHLVDALQGLEGESGIGRPLLSPYEREGTTRRSEAAHRLRAVERILPGTAAGEDPTGRPAFGIGAGGEGRVDLETCCDRAAAAAGRLTAALEAGRAADHRRQEAEAVRLAVAAFRGRGWEDLQGVAFSWALPAYATRPIERRLRRLGADVGKADGPRQVVLALRAPEARRPDLVEAARAAGGQPVVWPDGLLDDPASAAAIAESAATAAREADAAALAALRTAIDRDGAPARSLLDALEDAEAREASHRLLAATEYVAAVRAYVRPEELPALERTLEQRFGKDVIVRRLPPGGDEPTVPRSVAGVPFTALAGLRAGAYGSVTASALLALVVPLALGVALADLGAGLLLMILGGLLGIGAIGGSPRRDTSLLGQLGGVVSLVLGLLVGRAFSAAGVSLFGTSWGLAPALGLPVEEGARVFVAVLGIFAALFALWGVVVLFRHLAAHRPARAREATLGALHFAVIAGGAAAFALTPGDVLRHAWWLVPSAFVVVFLLAGGRGLGRLMLDLVGVARLTAVALLALLAFEGAMAALATTNDLATWVLAPLAVVVTLLAALVDPAHVAMGIPYDLSLGGRGLGKPFIPLARRIVRGRRLERGTRDG